MLKATFELCNSHQASIRFIVNNRKSDSVLQILLERNYEISAATSVVQFLRQAMFSYTITPFFSL